jgi:hypothetical protein
VGKSHFIKLIKLINLRRGDISFIAVNGTTNVFRTVTSLETLNSALVLGLDMCSEGWCKVSDFDVLKVIGNDVTREIILKEEDFPLLSCSSLFQAHIHSPYRDFVIHAFALFL